MMKRYDSLPQLSSAEQALMDLIWSLQPISVSDLLKSVNTVRQDPIIRNTLQTQLKRLEAKGWISRDDSGNVRLYRSTIASRPGRGKVLSELMHRLFRGSGASLVRCLMEDGGLSEKEIQELTSIIEARKKDKKL